MVIPAALCVALALSFAMILCCYSGGYEVATLAFDQQHAGRICRTSELATDAGATASMKPPEGVLPFVMYHIVPKPVYFNLKQDPV